MSLEHVLALASHPCPAFWCAGAGHRNGLYLARITHYLGEAAAPEDLGVVRKMLGPLADPYVALQEKHDGTVLYIDTQLTRFVPYRGAEEVDFYSSGIMLYPASLWAEHTREMRERYAEDIGEAESPDDEYGLASAVAIGEVPFSGNYFVVPTVGPMAGSILYTDHETLLSGPFARDLDEFLERITREPAQLLSEILGCYTRYSDGETNEQWYPVEYVADASGLVGTDG